MVLLLFDDLLVVRVVFYGLRVMFYSGFLVMSVWVNLGDVVLLMMIVLVCCSERIIVVSWSGI